MVAQVRSWWGKHPRTAWGLVLALALVAVFGAYVFAASAASFNQTRVPTSTSGTPAGTWTPSTGTTVWGVIDDAAPLGAAGDTDYVTHGTAAGNWWGGFTAFSVPAGVNITRVSVYTRGQRIGGGGVTVSSRLQVGGTTYTSGTPLTLNNAAWTNNQNDWTTNPRTGAAWTVADVNGTGTNPLQLFGLVSTDANPQIRISQMYIEVAYTSSELNVTQGADAGRPSAKVFGGRTHDEVVDELVLTAVDGPMTVTQVVVRGLDTVGTLQTDVSGVKLYRDDGDGAFDAGDTQLGTTQTFSGQASGSTATFSGLSQTVAVGTPVDVWVVYTIGGSAVDGHVVGSQVNNGDVTATGGTVNTFTNIVSANSGQTVQVDAVAPTANTSDPLDSAVLTGTTKTISGTASDGTGSGVSTVGLRIARSDGQYWNGSGWTGSETWVAATGTTNWTYNWALDAGQNGGPLTYAITARATDGVALTGIDATPVAGVKVDNVQPTALSATAPSATQVDVVFSEALQAGSISSTDFTIAGLTVNAATLDADNVTVHLTTSSQTANQNYTVQCSAGNVLDLAGNGNSATSANFTGYIPPADLTVFQGADTGKPSTKIFRGRTATNVVDEIGLTATGGTMTVNQVVVRGLDTAGSLQTDVSGVRLFRDNGATPGQWDGSDSQLGTSQTFSGQASGSTATFSGLGFPIPSGATENVWIVYTIGASAVDGHVVGSQVNNGDVTASGGSVNAFTNIVSANSGETIQLDAAAPTVDSADPIGSAVLTGTTKTISGTANDGTGSGVSTVQLRIARSDAQYWTGSGWTGTETWVAASGTANWTYAWSLDAGQNNGPLTYTVTARATDNVGLTGTDATPVTGVKVDNVAPSVSSASVVNATTVDVIFSEALQSGSVANTDFSIAGLTVSNAVLQGDNVTVRLTTSSQTANQAYTVQCNAGNVFDVAGNGNSSASANFTGYAPPGVLVVTQGADAGRPSTLVYRSRSANSVVDEISLAGTVGPVTLGQIVVRGLDTADTLLTDVSTVRLFRDNGATPGQWDGSDTQLGTGQTFSGDAGSGASTATFGSLALPIPAGATEKVWIVYTIGGSAVDGHVLGSRVSVGDVTLSGAGSITQGSNIVSANSGQTIQVDAVAPTANTSDPLDNAVLTGSSKTISGTASDPGGAGLTSVKVRIARSDGQFWTGTGWAGTESWVAVSGTANWTYAWSLDANQNNGPLTYAITARATDGAGLEGTDPTPVTGVKVDNVTPRIVSASTPDGTHVDVVFSEPLTPGSISSTDFSIAGLTISDATLRADNLTVRLTTAEQTASQGYTVQCTAGGVSDLAGNTNAATNGTFTGWVTGADTEPPTVPTAVSVTSGETSPTVATLIWGSASDNIGVVGYRVRRALALNGTYESVGTTASLAFADRNGIPGQDYYYTVAAFDAAGNESAQSAKVGPAHSTWTTEPHGGYTSKTDYCNTCHIPHAAAAPNILRDTGKTSSDEVDVCYNCHDGRTTGSNVKSGPTNSFAMASGHKLETVETSPDLTNECSACHSIHRDKATYPKLPKATINSVEATLTSVDNSWCLACHNDANDWYGSGYPSMASPTRDATGYPTSGTYPGKSIYNDPAKNAHATIPAAATTARAAGSCLYCHASHRGSNGYDGLTRTFRPTTASTLATDQASGVYAASCFYCHGGVKPSEFTTAPADIKRFVTAGDVGSGHRIKTAGGRLPVGAPLPCYDCHNPHGSSRGNSSMISDSLGRNLSTGSASGVRHFCLSCHATSGGDGWDSVAGAYVAVTAAQTVEGLHRDGSDGGVLRLPVRSGHGTADTGNCNTCHGASYGAGGNNVHNPNPKGESSGGENCFSCHSYQSMQSATSFHHYMKSADATSPLVTDPASLGTESASRTCLMCHVDHDFFSPELNADAAHTNGRAQNLRASISVEPSKTVASTYVNTDHDGRTDTSPGGVCVSCHSVRMDKNTTGRKSSADRFAKTLPVSKGAYFYSAHNYSATTEDYSQFSKSTTFTADASTFSANCAKCHNDDMAKSFQTGPYEFGTHDGSRTALQTSGGQAGFAEDPQEQLCWLCHSRSFETAGPYNPNGGTSYGAGGAGASSDLYGGGIMMGGMQEFSADLKGLFTNPAIVSRHPITGDGSTTARVECANCHNVHKTQPDLGFVGDGVAQDPDNTLEGGPAVSGDTVAFYSNPASGDDHATNRDYCLKCHDGDAPTKVNDGTSLVPYDVYIPAADEANANPSERPDKSNYVGRSHFNAIASDTEPGAQTIGLSCSVCHDNHGSTLPSLLGVNNNVTGAPTIMMSTVTGNNNTVCFACHTSGSGGSYSRETSGYPSTGPWPGQATYDAAFNSSSHTGNGHLSAVWPGRSYGAGDCKNCHDVHGTANARDELRTETPDGTEGVYGFANDDFSLCFNCHDGAPAGSDIKRFYPTEVGGTATQTSTSRFGHKTKTAGNLPAGSALPCYDCHNPHGSADGYGLMVVTETAAGTSVTLGDDAGELNMGSGRGNADVRRFCLSCHVTSDASASGWNGTAMATVGAGAMVEGLQRDGSDGSLMRLPDVSGHKLSDGTSCYGCHGNDYAVGGNNVHNPTKPTVSIPTGGQPCYQCHATWQAFMEDGTGAKSGANRTDTYHHVMGGNYDGGAYLDGDYAPGETGTYNSTAKTDVFCVSCHVDHDKFNPTKGSNLRSTYGAGPVTPANTDYSAAFTDGGVCTSCHTTALDKDVTNQKSSANGNSTDTSVRTPVVGNSEYDASAHQYKVQSTYDDATSFQGDCVKCHNDEDIGSYKQYQNSAVKFGPHFSATRRILSAFGIAASDPIGEYDCYGCHAAPGRFAGAKTTTGYDWYGTSGAAMSSLSELVFDQFTFTDGSHHPVESAGGNQLTCVNCHNAHVVNATSKVTNPDNTYNLAPYATAAEQAGFCLKCHDGAQPAYQVDGATYVPQTVTIAPGDTAVMNKSAYAARGHWSASGSISSGEVVACARCHDNHGSNAPKLLGEYTPADSTNRINNHVITANDNTACFACHNAASTSFPAGEAQREAATGYVMNGTFPGETQYASAYNSGTHLGNGHLNATWPGESYAAGDCKNCHNVHGTANTYDVLKATDGSGSYAYSDASFTMCFKCHGANAGSPGYATSNIMRYYPASAGGTGSGQNAGHQIKSTVAGANLTAGQALPCYDCHNPHGSRGQFSLQVRDIGDVAGEIDISSDDGLRKFCFACHATADTTEGWTGSAYAGVGTTSVEGLRRDSSDGSIMKLSVRTGHRRTDTQSCYQCHLNDSTSNVHNPAGGASLGGQSCYGCHADYQTYMEDDSGSKTGANNATVYHHVLGGSAGDGDIAPNTGSYQTSTSDVYCTSCHTDHNYFNASKSGNLRSDATNASGASPSDTDYSTASNSGVCTSCHAASRTKQGSGTEQKSDGSTATPKIVAGSGANQFGASAHNYTTTSSFDDASTFKANCSKCHNDENNPAYKTFQTSSNKFGTHWSSERQILSALGGTLTDPLSETQCFGCHTGGTAGNDYYGGQAMTQAARRTQQQFQMAYKHPVVATGGNSVECENCHNPHVVDKTTGKVTDPANAYNSIAYATESQRAVFCLKCHSGSGSLPTYTVNDTTYVPSTVTIAAADQALMNKSTNGANGHWSASGSISAGEIASCAVCHDNHGSSYAKILGAYDPTTNTNKISGQAITGDNNTVCTACHTAASTGYPTPTRNGSGYWTDGTWPGNTVYTVAYNSSTHTGSMHNTSGAQLPGKTYVGGDCKNCHDVHGTQNPRDELRTEDAAGVQGTYDFSASNFGFCFNCHDTDGPAARNIKTFYPASVGGSAGGSGHQIKSSGGTLPVGGVVPCYDCHNPHGAASSAYGLTLVAQLSSGSSVILGDGANEIKMSPADKTADVNNIRNFCFICHTTADTTKGWNGSSLVAISAGATVEGLDRTTSTVLHLPNRAGHREADTTQSCYTCHGSDYASLSGNNIHNPSGGVSSGGSDCYTCHNAVFQTYMEDGSGTKTGSGRAGKYHHVVGGTVSATYYDGDKAFNSGSYPTLASEVFCLSCHVDHNKFNSSKSGNLRSSGSDTNPTGVAYDYSVAGNTGVCTDCHATSLTKQNPGTDQLSDGSTAAPKIVAGAAAGQYGASAHNYAATSTYSDATAFSANCAKCHNDENNPTYKDFQNSTNKFGTHWSTERHILSALGGALTDPLSETHCYGCHTGATAGNDFYGTATMTQASRRTQQQFGLTSKHPVVATGGNSVECENCHNAHVVDKTTGKVTDPANTYNILAYGTEAEKATFCLKCHSAAASLPTKTVNGTTYIPSTVTIAAGDQALMNKSTYGARGHWSTSGSIASGEIKSCAICHDNHGSNYAKLIGAYDPSNNTNKVNGAAITGNDNSVCAACHGAASTGYPNTTRDANNYPSDGTFPGTTVYNGASGLHKAGGDAENVIWPGSTYTDGDCKNCHDVHGTVNTYDELRSPDTNQSYAKDSFTLCFNCHDGSPSAHDVKRYYPTTVGGGATQTASTRFGHRTESAGTLPAGSALPCYDCHNPHGSSSATHGLLVVTMTNSTATIILGDSAGEIDITAAAGQRAFCFACHTTAGSTSPDTNPYGWNGSAYAIVGSGALFEGIDRTVYNAGAKTGLKLPPVAGHYRDDTASCYSCHGNDYTGAASNNIHNPGAGGSSGGLDCLNCHGSTGLERMDKMVNDTTTYHHVLDAASPGVAPNTGAYPTSTNALACVSCHTDHNYFNGSKSSNLRTSITGAGSSVTNTDFIAGGSPSYGVCLSCHTTAQTKSTSQKTTGASAQTPALSATDYDVSAHDYAASSTFGDATSFQANCVKCHDDEQDSLKSYQTSTNKFGMHYSAENRIAKALGVALAGSSTASEENLCYLCHITAAQSATDKKTVAGRDAYNVTNMSALSESIYSEFQKTYKHPIPATSGLHKSDEGAASNWNPSTARHSACEDCHNPHASKAGTTPHPTLAAQRTTVPPIAGSNAGVWGVDIDGNGDSDWAGTGTFGAVNSQDTAYPTTYTRLSTSAYQWQMCLKCHSTYSWGTSAPTVSLNLRGLTGGKQTDVGEDFNPKNYAIHPVFTTGKNQPTNTVTWVGGTNLWDTTTYRRNINGTTTGNTLTNTFLDGWRANSRVVCTDCHNNNDPAGASGPHGSTQRWLLTTADANVKVTYASGTVVYPNTAIAANGAGGNFCLNCHRADVYSWGIASTKPSTTEAANVQNAEGLSRVGHRGGGMNNSCNQAAKLTATLSYSGCLNCHGGRKDANSYGGAATFVNSGAIHGTSMGGGYTGDDYTDPMGIRFMNGASWGSHQLGDTAGSVGCSTLGKGTVPSDANYGTCTQHNTTTTNPNYYYARPTN